MPIANFVNAIADQISADWWPHTEYHWFVGSLGHWFVVELRSKEFAVPSKHLRIKKRRTNPQMWVATQAGPPSIQDRFQCNEIEGLGLDVRVNQLYNRSVTKSELFPPMIFLRKTFGSTESHRVPQHSRMTAQTSPTTQTPAFWCFRPGFQ